MCDVLQRGNFCKENQWVRGGSKTPGATLAPRVDTYVYLVAGDHGVISSVGWNRVVRGYVQVFSVEFKKKKISINLVDY